MPNTNANRHYRRSIRLPDYDYTWPGAYFVTICTHKKECLFGDVVEGRMYPNEYGEIILECWNDLPNHYPHVELDAFVVMPNHVHGIINLLHQADVGAGFKPAPTTRPRHGLPEIVRAFKTFSSRRINQNRNNQGVPVWQRNYYEHVIRNERELGHIRNYIVYNPAKWDEDADNPANFSDTPMRAYPC